MQQIRFGDVICIGDAEARGFVSGDPYLTDDIFVDSYQGFDLQTVGQNQLQCFFIIEHAYEFSAAKAFQRKLRKAPLRLTEKTWKSELDPSEPLYVELEQLHARKEDEKASNEVEAKRIAGLPVCYGSHIQLRQLSSSMFLTQSKNRAVLNALALEVYLAEEGSKWSIWKVVPTVRIRGDGEGVHYGEEVSFASVKQRSSYLSTFVAPDLLAPPLNSGAKPTSTQTVQTPKFHEEAKIIQPDGVTQRFEVNSSASWTKYHLILMRRHEPKAAHNPEGADQHVAIRCNDVVTICHKQHDLFLVADEKTGVRWQPRADAWFDSERPKARAMWTLMHWQVDQGTGYLGCPSEHLVIHHLATGLGLQAGDPHTGSGGKLVLRKSGRGQSKWALTGPDHMREASRQGVLHEGDFVWLKADRRKGRGGGFLSVKGAKAGKQNVVGFSPGMPEYNGVGSAAAEGVRSERRHETFEACLRDTGGGELLDMVELSVVDPTEWQVADLVRRATEGLRHIKRSLAVAAVATAGPSPSQRSRAPEEDETLFLDGNEEDADAVHAWFAKSELRKTLLALEAASDVSFGVSCAMCDPRASLPKADAGHGHTHAADGHKPRPRHGMLTEQWRGHGLGSLYHRELLRELGVLEAAVDIARVCLEKSGVFPSEMGSAALLQSMLARCFRLVELACKGSNENKQAMAAALPIMQAALVADCGAYGAMLAVYAGTRQLLEGLHAEVFRDTVASMVATRLPSVLSFAIETCICDGEPIKSNQDRWATVLFPADDTPPVFLDVVHRNDDYFLGTWATVDGRRLLLSLQQMKVVVEGLEDEEMHTVVIDGDAVVEYHCYAMELLCAMLRGGNALPRTLVATHSQRLGLESTQLVDMVRNDDLPDPIRARCVQVLQHLYVEQSPVNLPMRNSALWVWTRLQRGLERGESGAFSFGARRERLKWGGEDAMEQCKKVKDVVIGKLSNVESKVGPQRKDCELEKSLVSLLAAMVESGYYHREENGELIVDIAQVSALGHPLMGVLDDRSFSCNKRKRDLTPHMHQSPLQSGKADSGRALVELKVATLKLLGRLIECCWEGKMEILFAGWESVLSDSLGCHGWQDLLAATNDAVKQGSATDPHHGPAVQNRAQAVREAMKNAPRRLFRKGEASLVDYIVNPSLWATKPPWKSRTVAELGRRLFERHPFMEELSYNQLLLIGSQSSHERLPEVLKIVLWQLMFDDITLKESTLHFLFQTYQQHTSFLRRVRNAKFICQPGTFEILPNLQTQVNTLRAVSRVIRDGALPPRHAATNFTSYTTLASVASPHGPPPAPSHPLLQPGSLASSDLDSPNTANPRLFVSWQKQPRHDGPIMTRSLSWSRHALPSPSGRESIGRSLSWSRNAHTPSSAMVSPNSSSENSVSPTYQSRSRAMVSWQGLKEDMASPLGSNGVSSERHLSAQTPKSDFGSVTTDEATPVALLDHELRLKSPGGLLLRPNEVQVEVAAGKEHGNGERDAVEETVTAPLMGVTAPISDGASVARSAMAGPGEEESAAAAAGQPREVDGGHGQLRPAQRKRSEFEDTMLKWYEEAASTRRVSEETEGDVVEEEDDEEGAELRAGAEEAQRILEEWNQLSAATAADGEHSVEELSHVMQVLKSDDILLSLLSACPASLFSGGGGGATVEALTKMVTAGCSLVSTLCSTSSDSHTWWSEHAEVLWQFVGTEGVDAESTLAVIAADNLEVLSKHGKEWIGRYFRLVGEVKVGAGVTVRGLKFLTRLLTYKGTPMPEHNVRALAYFEDQEATMEALMKGEEQWDRRIELMEANELLTHQEGHLALHLASVDFLAAACVGKSTAAAVYTSHFLPFKHVVRTLLAMSRDSSGREHDVSPRIKIRVKASFLRLLFHVFLETKVQHLLADRHRLGSGLWQVDQRDPRVAGTTPLMDALVADLRGFRAVAHSFIADQSTKSMDEELFLRDMAEYFVWAWVPMVAGTFRQHAAVLAEHCPKPSQRVAEQIVSELVAMDVDDLPACCASVVVHRKKVLVKEAARSALTEVLVFTRKGLQADEVAARGSFRVEKRARRPEQVVREGMRAFIDSVAANLGAHRGFKANIGAGNLQLAHFFAMDGKVRLCRESEEDGQGPHRCEVAYADVVRSVLDLSSTHATGSGLNGLLVDILQTMRAAIYLAEPAHPYLNMEEMANRWEACMRDEKMEKKFEPKAAMLEWVQNKFDALGCTAAAVRLLNHECREVQLNALRLMLALLQTGNARVQNNVRGLFASKAGRGALQRLKNVISGGVELISVNYKRSIKTRKQAEQLRYLAQAHRDVEDGAGQNGFGRRSLLMLALRVVQLLMEGQNAALQNQIAKAHGGTSVFDQCIRLFLAIQPVLGDSFSSEDSELAVLCIQVVETVSECIQGPNRTSQQILLRSNFFAGVNRLVCSITYTPQTSEMLSPELPLQTNDLKCWLKFSLLGCCIAVFEAVRDEAELQGFFELVHVRNLISQITASAQVLGLPLSSAHNRSPFAGQGSSSGLNLESSSAWSAHDPSVRDPSVRDPSLFSMRRQRSFFSRSTQSTSEQGNEVMTSVPNTPPSTPSRSRKSKSSADKHVAFEIEARWKASFAAPDSDEAMLDEILRLYILLLMFKEYAHDPAHAIRIRQFEEEEPALARFLEMHTSHIECIRPTSHLTKKPLAEKVFFALRPQLALLIRSKRFRMKASLEIFNVPRDNPWEKGCEFMKRIKIVHNRVHWLEVIRQSSFLDRCIAWRGRLDSAPLRLSGIITLLLLSFYGVPWDPNSDSVFGGGGFFSFDAGMAGYTVREYPFQNQTSDQGSGATYGEVMSKLDLSLKYRLSLQSRWDHPEEWRSFWWARGLLYALAVFHVLFTALACFLHLIIDFPLVFIACFDTKRASKVNAGRDIDLERVDRAPVSRRSEAVAAHHNQHHLPPIPQPPETYVSWGALRSLVWHSKLTLYYAVLMCISILGVASSPFFLVMFLLDVFRGVSGALVVRSLIVGGPNLIRTFLLAIVVLVCFGFMSYAYFSVAVNGAQELCHSPFQCVAMHLLDSFTGDLTTVLGDDLGDFAFPGTALWSGGWESWRTFVVVLSIISWVFLLQGIIQGQIIDAFAEMRNKMQEARDDLERKCFVSSVDRFMFQNYPGEWDKRKSGKFAWNYLLYFSHLRRKDPEEYNGMDHLADKAFEEERADLLPIGTFVAKQREELSQRDSNLQEVVEQYKAELARMQALTSSLLAQSASAGLAGAEHPSPSPTARATPPNLFFRHSDIHNLPVPPAALSTESNLPSSSVAGGASRPPLWLASRGGGAHSRTVAEELIDGARSDGETELTESGNTGSDESKQRSQAGAGPVEWEIVGQLASMTRPESSGDSPAHGTMRTAAAPSAADADEAAGERGMEEGVSAELSRDAGVDETQQMASRPGSPTHMTHAVPGSPAGRIDSDSERDVNSDPDDILPSSWI